MKLTLRAAMTIVCLCLSVVGQQRNQQIPRDLRQRNELPPAPTKIPRGYALVIGIGNYPNLGKEADLLYAEGDAQAIFRVLLSKEGGAIPAENIHLILGKDAGIGRIRHEVEEWLPSVAGPEDRVVVFFAGHGFVGADGEGFLAASDIRREQSRETAYPMAALADVMSRRVKARWKVLLTDACHSGKINSSEFGASMDDTQFLSFTATIGRQNSYEDPKIKYGIFSYYLELGLKGNADADPCDGWVTAGELVQYVTSQVHQHSKEAGVSQTPHVGGDYDPAMILAKSHACGAVVTDERTSGALVIEANLDDVDVWVDDNLRGRLGRDAPLSVPGLRSGEHTVCGRKQGYEPDCRQVLIAPLQRVPVSLRIRYPQKVKPKARELCGRGIRLLYSSRSTVNPVNIVPVLRRQSANDLRGARDLFARALQEDGSYALAAYHLGVSEQLLGDETASIRAFRKAIALDPESTDSRMQLAGVLIECGDTDEAIRNVVEALRRDQANAAAHALMARAYLDKGVWRKCVEEADKAITFDDSVATAHLWRGDCLRHLAAKDKSSSEFRDAGGSYARFLRMTNFSTPVHQWLAYHFVGFRTGGQVHADRRLSYESLRKAGFLGLCICESNVGNLVRAGEYCRRAILYDRNDPIAYFTLGVTNLKAFNKRLWCEDIRSARSNFIRMLALSPALEEAKHARRYIDEIDGRMRDLRRNFCP
ncbi:MAG: caspase family protein [Bryobacterales bacterium]|nr:caspase family protein [Bryobacterales bacterium]